MNLQNLKNQKGFTIVELLIVIVVIGILAAIVIVAYNGVTQRANTSAAKGNAESVKKVAEVMNADTGNYPSGAAAGDVITSLNTGSTTSRIPNGVTIENVATNTNAITSTNGKTTIGYKASGGSTTAPTGGCVAYYDYSAGGVRFVGVGAATVNSGATTCT